MTGTPKTKLLLFTSQFPFGKGESFLANELEILRRYFDITLVPSRIPPGNPIAVSTEIRYETGLSVYLAGKKAIQLYLAGILFSLGLQSAINWRGQSGRVFPGLKQQIRYSGLAWFARKWLAGYLSHQNASRQIWYTYWLSHITLALASLKTRYACLLVTRVHGFDLYSERQNAMPAFLAQWVWKNIDRVYPISEHGQNYLIQHYGAGKELVQLSKLGVFEPGFLNAPSPDNDLRIVSCAYLVGVKRTHLIIDAFNSLISTRPGLTVHWHHIGGGPLLADLRDQADLLQGKGMHIIFHGDLSNPQVFEVYRNFPFDVFLNVSSSEGLPVSIMEAQSVGIPVIATAVGGTPEIVNDRNGLLLLPNPDAARIAEAVISVFDQRGLWIAKRNLSRKNWELNFDAVHNFNLFAQELTSLSLHE